MRTASRVCPSRRHRLLSLALLLAVCGALGACSVLTRTPNSFATARAETRLPAGTLPRPAHVVIVIEENKAYSQIIGNRKAPFLNRLAAHGALLTHYYGITHPSEPNYLALFSGSTHGLHLDSCPHHYASANLASELTAAGFSFATYSQSLPQVGYSGCRHGRYARKHNPAVNWQGVDVRPGQNRPFRNFPHQFQQLPTVSLVIPDLDHDMHSASIKAGDQWLASHLGRYARWAEHHHSLLIVTWDEDNYRHHNHIPTLIVGGGIPPMRVRGQFNHYSLLRTLEAMYGLPRLGKSADAMPITAPWASG